MTAVHITPPRMLADRVRVVLIGCGGNGSQMLTGLARLDHAIRALGHPGLDVEVHDPDTVSQANIGRQLFSPADVGQFKASVHVQRVNHFFGLDWRAIPTSTDATKMPSTRQRSRQSSSSAWTARQPARRSAKDWPTG